MIDFLLYALLAGLGVATIAGPLGVFVVWRKMAYFGDTLAHSALIGVALGLLWHIHLHLAIIATSVLVASAVYFLQKRTEIAIDSLLGILSHSALALGLICVSVFAKTRIDLFSYLFGDLLTVSGQEIAIIFAVSVASNLTIIYFWRSLLMIAIDEELAQVEGFSVNVLRLLLMLLVALAIAIAMKVVGVLLITALLIVPAAASRQLSSSPEAMALIASLIGMLSVVCGLGFSYWIDTPTGPSIVLAASLFFCASLVRRRS